MNSSISVKNISGADQSVVVMIVDPGQPDAFPIIWKTATIPDQNTIVLFDCDLGAFGLGWGTASDQLAPGGFFALAQSRVVGQIGAADATNRAALSCHSNVFSIATPYRDNTVSESQIVLASDASFDVSAAQKQNACAALCLQGLPVMAQQLAPSTNYYYSPLDIIVYLAVTKAPPGTVVPPPIQSRGLGKQRNSVSISTPTAVMFSPGVTSLSFTLSSTLSFNAIS